MFTAVVSGSFDPFTIGHNDIVSRAKAIFGKVVVAVSANTSKNCMFTLEQRMEAIKNLYKDEENIEIVKLEGLLADYVKSINGILVRGVRNSEDYVYEENLYEINREINGTETVFLPASPDVAFVSSTFARDMILYDRNTDKYIPEECLKVYRK